jgi:hypothetical protein
MNRFTAAALSSLLLLPATDVRADCNWGWYCDKSARCGMVPYCDSPTDKPPPLQGARLPHDGKPQPVRANSHRKPLPGFKPINPPPPGMAPVAPPDSCLPDKKCPAGQPQDQ